MTSTRFSGDDAALSIGDLAARTGVSAATLRTWENRYGLPAPRRLPGGHRRYRADDVELVREILRRRAAGQTMTAAIADVLAAASDPEPSVYAGLLRRHPALRPQRITKNTLLALTRAIEDECCARAQRPLLFVAFQQRRFYEQSRPRWAELGRTARAVAIFADFGQSPATGASPLLVPLPADSPLRREWILVCDSPDYPACVTGWEHPGQRGVADRERTYEAIWSAEARVVRDAARICADLAGRFAPGTPPLSTLLPEAAPPESSDDLQRADGLFTRVLGYLDTASS